MRVDIDRCGEMGLDVDKVFSLARRISKAGREAKALGLVIFGGAGSGDLRAPGGAQNIVATLDGSFDGGDGGDEY